MCSHGTSSAGRIPQCTRLLSFVGDTSTHIWILGPDACSLGGKAHRTVSWCIQQFHKGMLNVQVHGQQTILAQIEEAQGTNLVVPICVFSYFDHKHLRMPGQFAPPTDAEIDLTCVHFLVFAWYKSTGLIPLSSVCIGFDATDLPVDILVNLFVMLEQSEIAWPDRSVLKFFRALHRLYLKSCEHVLHPTNNPINDVQGRQGHAFVDYVQIFGSPILRAHSLGRCLPYALWYSCAWFIHTGTLLLIWQLAHQWLSCVGMQALLAMAGVCRSWRRIVLEQLGQIPWAKDNAADFAFPCRLLSPVRIFPLTDRSARRSGMPACRAHSHIGWYSCAGSGTLHS